MKYSILVLGTLMIFGCFHSDKNPKNNLIHCSQNIDIGGEKLDDTLAFKVFNSNISIFNSDVYNCFATHAVWGDINGDNKSDLIVTYLVNSIALDAPSGMGWVFFINNGQNQLSNLFKIEWDEGRCGNSRLDLGTPYFISKKGIIHSTISKYSEKDACCCPSINANVKYRFNENRLTIGEWTLDD